MRKTKNKEPGMRKKRNNFILGLTMLITVLTLITITYAIPYINTDKEDYELGDKVIITIGNATNDSILKIINGENIFKFIGELNHKMEFVPQHTGEFVASLEYEIYKEVKTNFTVNPKPEVPTYQSVLQEIYTPTDSLTDSQTNTKQPITLNNFESTYNSENITISKNWLIIRNHEQEAVDKELDLFDYFTGTKYATTDNATHNPVGIYDTELNIDNYPIKKIVFKNLEARGNSPIELRIDDLTNNTEKAGEDSKQFYVIDPTSLNFTNATVTVTAKGGSLRKCKDWNYTTQTCYGTWEFIMDLTPGQNYTFLITPDDPAYNETTNDADDCYNGVTACTVDEVTAISADGGTTYAFSKSGGTPIIASFENEPSTIVTIEDCTVYVNGYDSEGNTWNLQTGNWSTQTWDNAGSGQTAPSPENTLTWDCLSHFTSNNNDESLFDDFAVRITTDDGSKPATAYLDHIYVVINFTIPDSKAPYYSGIVASPTSPSTFTPASNTYQFNTTWTDNEGINTSWIEHNFTGTMTNYTNTPLSNNSEGAYYYNYGPIGVGTYAWRTHANDTATNLNSSMPFESYEVKKANSTLELLLNNTDGNFTFNNTGTVNITGTIISGEADIFLYEDGNQFDTGPSPLTNIRLYNDAGVYNITLRHFESQNYTASNATHFIFLDDTIPPGLVTGLGETDTGTTWILWNWTNATELDLDHVEVWLNGTFQANTTKEYINLSGLLSDTTYEIQVRSVDNWTTPNIGVYVNDTAQTETSADVQPPAITNVENTSITDQTATITWNTEEDASSVVKYGTSSGTYTLNITNISITSNHEVILENLSSSTTYFYVVNSSDAAGNSNQSIEYNFTTLSDQASPYYSGIVAEPASGATYSPTGTYQFNTTWQDNEQVGTVWIEHNFTGTMINYTNTPLDNNSEGAYYYNYGPIAAGSYAWRTHANDTATNLNSSMPFESYEIQKASSAVNLLLNGTDGNYSINESYTANFTGILVTGQGNVSLYQNKTLISQGPSPLTNITLYTYPSTWNITVVYNETQNYTSQSEYHILKVNDTIAPWINLTEPYNDSTDLDGDVIFKFLVNDTSNVKNCSLYINDGYDQYKDILTKGENTFTKNDLENGDYTWYVNCSDYADNTNVSLTWDLTILINEYYPHLVPLNCSDNSGGCNRSRMNNTPNVWEEHGTLEKGAGQANYVYINLTQESIPAGSRIHWMYIFYDKYQETTEGFLRLEWLNGTDWETAVDRIEICSQNFGSGTSYAHDLVNCSFDNTTNMPTLSQINSGIQLRAEFYYSGTAAGKSYGTDEAYVNIKYTEDTTPPTIELVEPNYYHLPGIVNFTYIPSDANLVNCTFYEDFDTTFGPNITEENVISGEKDNFTFTLPIGYYTWNVYCCDIAGNCAFDQIGGVKNDGNYTVNITNPDLIVRQIQFNMTDNQTKTGMNITINATIHNKGNVNVTGSFTVQFYLGDPDSGGLQINGDQTITTDILENENATVNVSWVIDAGGPRPIYVIVDTPLATNGSIQEINETNNKNNRTLNVPSYNYFYGSVKTNLSLSNLDNESFYYYLDISNTSGNILVTDEESIPSFNSLQAIGRDINNNTASNDYNDTDNALNMTNYTDSIRWSYTKDTDIPILTTTMTLYTREIENIPIINSINTTDFITGLLWDMNDGVPEYDGTQDLIFITQINQDKTGAYGTYDYEMKIPVNLKDYATEGSTIDFYWEITDTAS